MLLERIRIILSVLALALMQTAMAAAPPPATLTMDQRTLHVFRAPLGMFSPDERATAARQRIEAVIDLPGEGWTSVTPTEQGRMVELDGRPLFLVLPADADTAAGESAEAAANRASRALQKLWSERRERSDPQALIDALVHLAIATAVVALTLVAAIVGLSRLRRAIVGRLEGWFGSRGSHVHSRLGGLVPALVGRLLTLISWGVGLFATFAYLSYSLSLFVATRPAGESLAASVSGLGRNALLAVVGSLPGLFVVVLIFLAAWVATRIATEVFTGVEARPLGRSWLNAHTAPTTRRIVNASLWLFAVAMAYPYLPGAHTDAFKGLSVLIGLMASIGASGAVGQVAAGVMIVYTYALTKGEYVRIQEHEGTVVSIGLFEIRLRNGLGEEVSLPNAYVLGNVTRNYSRARGGHQLIVVPLSIGYDTPWRQVQAMLREACATVPEILAEPAAQVVQSALADFYVEYKLLAHADADAPAARARITSDLNAAILDTFNRHGVQIMSPHYQFDPATPKLVPPEKQPAS